ncbi:MAG: hypothetical protein ACRD2B_16780 [Terriglobia bacterium]
MSIQIKGDKVKSLQTTGDVWVEVQLNQEAGAEGVNKGKKAPEHYQNVVGQPFLNAVIVQEGSYIQFKIRSHGELGFGHRIVGGLKLDGRNKPIPGEARPDIIVSQLYCLPPVSSENMFELDKGADLYDIVQRYQDSRSSMIAVDGFKRLNLSTDDRDKMVTMMNCTVTSWGVYGFIDDATDIDYGHPADIGRVEWGPGIAGLGVGGRPVRQGTSIQAITKVRQIREDYPDAAPNYVNFAFLVDRPSATAAGGGPVRAWDRS